LSIVVTPEMIDRLPRVRATIGAGPHTCIGMSFGVQQAIVVPAMILRVYRLDLVAGHRVTPVQRLTVRPKQIALGWRGPLDVCYTGSRSDFCKAEKYTMCR
jgi:hypothetical protein